MNLNREAEAIERFLILLYIVQFLRSIKAKSK